MAFLEKFKRSYLEVRPAKSALYRKIGKEVWNIKNEINIGMDVASARFDHRRLFFPVKTYIGLDMNENRLREGLRKYPSDIGIQCDISTVGIPEGCADLIISSNTLYWIKDSNKRLNTIQTLAKAVNPEGKLIVEMPNDQMVSTAHALLQEFFDTIDVSYIGNFLSVWYDKFISRKRDGEPYFLTRIFPVRIISFLLTLFETYRYKSFKKHALFICTRKINPIQNQFLPENLFDRLDQNLYRQKNFNAE